MMMLLIKSEIIFTIIITLGENSKKVNILQSSTFLDHFQKSVQNSLFLSCQKIYLL
jgi:hypothetical protein